MPQTCSPTAPRTSRLAGRRRLRGCPPAGLSVAGRWHSSCCQSPPETRSPKEEPHPREDDPRLGIQRRRRLGSPRPQQQAVLLHHGGRRTLRHEQQRLGARRRRAPVLPDSRRALPGLPGADTVAAADRPERPLRAEGRRTCRYARPAAYGRRRTRKVQRGWRGSTLIRAVRVHRRSACIGGRQQSAFICVHGRSACIGDRRASAVGVDRRFACPSAWRKPGPRGLAAAVSRGRSCRHAFSP